MSAQYCSVDEVVTLYLDRSEQSDNKYFKCWNIAFSGMEQLGLDFFYRIRSLKLPVMANRTVVLPADYIKYSKIGVLNSKGEVVPLAYNDKLALYADLLPDRISKTQDNTLFSWYVWNSPIFYNWWNGDTFVNLYGVPSGAPFVGSFKIDNANGVILLDEGFSFDYIIIEYVSSPQEGTDYYIPIEFKEALMWFIAWNDISMLPNSRRGTLGDKEQRKRNYFNERRLGLSRYKPLSLQQAYEQNLENQRLTVKA